MLSVDVLSGCTAYMLEEGPLALVSTREKMTVWVGNRGLLQRGHGMSHHFAQGARLAAARICDTADGRDAELLDGHRFMPMGGEWTASDAPVDAPVRLS